MHWLSIIWRLTLFILLGAVTGWALGDIKLGIIAILSCIVLYWSVQMRRMQRWLEGDTETPAPPDVPGIWGDMVSSIYRHQRQSADDRERLNSLVDYLLESFASMRDGVVLVEQGGGIRWCNQTASELLGLRFPQDTGQNITNLVRAPAFIRYFTGDNYEEPLHFSIGRDAGLHLQLIITRFAEGDRLLFIRDITQWVRTEQIRRDFVSNVSHELRTPLTVISGYLGNFMLDEGALPEKYHRALQQMSQQAQRMENLLKDLLWLSRIESDEHALKREAVDVAALLEELRDEVGHGWPDRELTLQVETRRKLNGDYRQLYSCISNLVVNAIKYSPAKSPVHVHWREEGQNLVLSVTDQGIGIEAKHLPRLTERFYRVDDSRNSSTGGTGLGLAIVKHVVASHGARLFIDSTLGKGSCFSITFSPPAVMQELH